MKTKGLEGYFQALSGIAKMAKSLIFKVLLRQINWICHCQFFGELKV